MWKLGVSPVVLLSRSIVGGLNAISRPTTSFSSIASAASSKFATANRPLLGSGGGVFLASLRCFSSFGAHPTTLQHHHHEEGKESAPEPEMSTYPVLVVPRPKNQLEAEDHDGYYHYFHLADFEEIKKEEDEDEDEGEPPKTRRIKKNNIPGVTNYDCVGSSHGWLAFMDPNNSSIYFVNPLIHSNHIRESFRLPPIPANNLEGGGGVPFIQKVALSSPPYEDSYTAAAIYGPGRDLAFYEPKDGTWWTPGGGVGDYSDVIYSKKDGFFYTIRNPQANSKCTDSPIQAWDPFSRQSTLIHPSFEEPQFHFLSDKHLLDRSSSLAPHVDEKRYLVESSPSSGGSGGDLYLLLRYVCKCVDKYHGFYPPEDSLMDSQFGIDVDPFITYKTFFFDGYKLNRDNDGMSYWVEEYDLGGQCFFVGMNHSFSVPEAHLHKPVLSENCVYYSDDCFDKIHLLSNSGGHDNGVCRIDSIQSVIYNRDLSKYKPPPIWLDVLSQP